MAPSLSRHGASGAGAPLLRWPPMREFVISRRSDLRLSRAREFLSALPSAGEVLVLSATFEAGAEVTRSLGRALFGWRRSTPYRCALELARPRLLELGLTAATPLSLEALWARVAYELGETGLLHRLSPLEGKPGLSRALARTVAELRLPSPWACGCTITLRRAELG